MANNYYNFTGGPFVPGTKARSDQVNTEYQAIVSAFDLLPSSNTAIVTGKATFAGATGGSGNAYTVSMPNQRTAYAAGDEVTFIANRDNTGGSTLNVDSLGAIAIVRADGTALDAGDLVQDLIYTVRYDNTNTRFQLMTPNTSYLTDAEASAAAAAVSEINAAASESAAATSETNAAASALEASHWAQYAEDSLVPEGNLVDEYSAYHWSKKAEGWAASLNLPTMSGQALKFLRANAGETSLEYYNLFDSYNTWTKNQTFQDNVSQTILQVKPGSATYDAALNGMIVYKSDGSPRGFFGAIPDSIANYFNIWVWNDALGTPAWNAAIGVYRDSVQCSFHNAGLLVDGSEVTRESRNNSFTGNNTFSGNNTFTADQHFTAGVFANAADPFWGLIESDQTNKNWSMQANGGVFEMHSRSDVWGDQGRKFYIADGALNDGLSVEAFGADSAGLLRATGYPSPASGAGVEVSYLSSIGYVTAYDRDTSAWKTLNLRGSQVQLSYSGNVGLTVTTTGDIQDAASVSLRQGKLIDVQVFTSSGTWTKPTGTNAIEVEMCGGGGGGGSVTGTGTGVWAAGGGGAGAYIKYRVETNIASSYVVTVGSAGAGGTGGGNGGAGTYSRIASGLGAAATCNGGAGGTNNIASGGGGTVTALGADVVDAISMTGQTGHYGLKDTVGSNFGWGGPGASGPLGFGGYLNTNTSQNGAPGQGYGSGGAGGGTRNTSATLTGGAGKPGIVIVRSYA